MSGQGRASSFCRLSVSAIKMYCAADSQRGSQSEPSKLVWDSDPRVSLFHQMCVQTLVIPGSVGNLATRKIQALPSRSMDPAKPIWKVYQLYVSMKNTPEVTLKNKEQTSGCQGTARGETSPRGAAWGSSVMMNRLHLGCGGDDMNLYTALNHSGGNQLRPVVCMTVLSK